MVYDSDEGTMLYDVNGYVQSPTASFYDNLSTPSLGISAMAYDSQGHRLLLSNGQTIYALTYRTAGLTTIASGFQQITSMTTDGSGNVYVVDTDHVATVLNGQPKALTPPGSIWATGYPASIAFDSKDGNLYVTNPSNDRIDRVTTTGTIVAFTGRCLYPAPNNSSEPCLLQARPGNSTTAVFGYPSGLAYDAVRDRFYMSDYWNNVIWSIDAQGNASILAGYGYPGISSGNGRLAFIAQPSASAIDQYGRLFFRSYAGEIGTVALTGSPAPSNSVPGPMIWSPTFVGYYGSVTSDNNGGAWVSEANNTELQHIDSQANVAEFMLPLQNATSYVVPLAVDAASNAWFGAWDMGATNARMIRMSPSGTMTSYPLSASPTSQTYASDGNVWIAEGNVGSGGYIASVGATSGTLHEYALPSPTPPPPGYPVFPPPSPLAVSQGPSGQIWFLAGGAIGRLSGGNYLPYFYSLPQVVFGMVHNPINDSEWYTGGNEIYEVSATGSVVLTMPGSCSTCSAPENGITVTPDGYVWTLDALDSVTRYDTNGNEVHYALPWGASLNGISGASDGTLWISTGWGGVIHFNPALYDQLKLPHAVPFSRGSSARPARDLTRTAAGPARNRGARTP